MSCCIVVVMFSSLINANDSFKFKTANQLALNLAFTKKVTPEIVEDALKFVKGMPNGAHVLTAAKCVACILPSQKIGIIVGGVNFDLPRFYDLALAKDSPYFARMLEPAFKDAKSFPDLDLEVFKSFLKRIYEDDASTPGFEEHVEALRMVYEYEFSGYAPIVLEDLIGCLKTFSEAQLETCYSLAHEIDEDLLIDTLDCMRDSPLPNPFSKSCTVTHISQLGKILEINPKIEFLEIRCEDLRIPDWINALKQFTNLKHVLIFDNISAHYTYNPFRECSYKVSLVMQRSCNLSIPTFENFEMLFIAKVELNKVVDAKEFLMKGSQSQETIKSFVKDINSYIRLIVRGAAFYNLKSIPNTLIYREQIGLFFQRHSSQFVEVDFKFIHIKDRFDLNGFIHKINSLSVYIKHSPYNSESDSD